MKQEWNDFKEGIWTTKINVENLHSFSYNVKGGNIFPDY